MKKESFYKIVKEINKTILSSKPDKFDYTSIKSKILDDVNNKFIELSNLN